MKDIKNWLKERDLPSLLGYGADWKSRREEIKEILCREFIGCFPRISFRTEGKVIREELDAYGGKAMVKSIELQIISDYSHASFSYKLMLPKNVKKPPVFVYLSFSPEIADGIGEEILDGGYGVASVYYQEIVPDYYDEHQNGLGRFCTRNKYDSWGKVAIWAFGASRILDDLLARAEVDEKRVAVMGHSRLGKAALVAGAYDERFALTVSNESGAGGAALFRGKTGEQIENLYGRGSRLWFAGNFYEYRKDGTRLPFDQHFLLALIAPRRLYVSSAAEDFWADPKSEFLGCKAASEAWQLYELTGLACPDVFPKVGESFQEGYIGYHLRAGSHYLSRQDWQQVIRYRNTHGV